MHSCRFSLKSIVPVVLLSTLFAAGCGGDSSEPTPSLQGAIRLALTFGSTDAALVDFDRAIGRASSVVNPTQVFADTVTFAPGADPRVVDLQVSFQQEGETFEVQLELVDATGTVLFRAGPETVAVNSGGTPAQPDSTSFVLSFVGPGLSATGVSVLTTDPTVFFSDTVLLSAEATDAAGTAIPGTPILWSSLDPSVADVPVRNSALVVGGTARGIARIVATLLTGQEDTVSVLVQPVPSAMALVGGDGQTGVVGDTLALALSVSVTAADGGGVKVPVVFATSDGGSFGADTVLSDTSGAASTQWVLGMTSGAQSATASAADDPLVQATFSADAMPGQASDLTFVVQPTDATAGAPLAPAIELRALDTFGNVDTLFAGSVTVTLGNNPGGATLGGTTSVALTNGIAAFGDLTLDRSGAGYTLNASVTGLNAVTSDSFDIAPDNATQLSMTVQPSNTAAGAAISPAIQVEALDQFGNVDTSFVSTVTVAIGTNPSGGTLAGSATVTAVQGVATFSDLSIDLVGSGYTLAFSSTGLPGASSNPFDIIPATASQLAFTVQPTSGVAGVAIAPAIQVEARDPSGNLDPAFTGNITIAIGTNPGGGTLSGTVTVAAVSGVATFGDLSVNRSGTGYTLAASATGLTAAASNVFNVSAAGATQLSVAVQPSNTQANAAITPAVRVEAQDQFGNVDPSFVAGVTIAIGTNPSGGTLGGTATVTAVQGAATFSDLTIDLIGTGYTLTASSAGLSNITSNTFDIIAAAASQLVVTVQPTNVVAGVAIAPAVQVEARDAGGNVDAGFTGDITIAIGTNPGGGALSGTVTVMPVNGIATFGDLSIDRTGTGYTLSASATGLTSAVSSAFDVSAASATQLAFAVQPSNTEAGVAISPAVRVEAQDPFGNVDPSFVTSVTIDFGLNAGGGPLGGTKTVTAVQGVATFSDLTIERAKVGYTLAVSATGLAGAVSNSFGVTPASATQLSIAVQPLNTVTGAAISPAVRVDALDQFGNVDTSFVASVTIAIGTNPSGGTLGGTTTVAAVLGAASFSDLTIDLEGVGYTLSASAAGLPGATSNTFDIVAPAGNSAPTAVIAANPTSVPFGDNNTTVVTLDGSGSSDPDGDTLTFFWTVFGGTFVNGTTATDEVVDVTFVGVTDYAVTLTVDDGKGGTDQAATTITVGN